MYQDQLSFNRSFLVFPSDLPPVYTYPSITMGYKAGPSSPEARLAEQATVEVEPAEPDPKPVPHQHLIQPLSKEEERREEEDERDCEVLESQTAEKEKEERRVEAKGYSFSEPESEISGLPPCPSTASVPDLACPATATGKALKVELSLGCLGQKTGLEVPQLSKEQRDDREHKKKDTQEDEGEKLEAEPTGYTVPVPMEAEEEMEKVEEDREKNGENVEAVEVEEEEEGSRMSPGKDLVELICNSPAHSVSPDPPTANTAAHLQGAYMWSLELLIAAALCATRDALCPPAPSVRAPSPPPHHGMEILGELAELEIQQRSRESREKDTEGEKFISNELFLYSHSLQTSLISHFYSNTPAT